MNRDETYLATSVGRGFGCCLEPVRILLKYGANVNNADEIVPLVATSIGFFLFRFMIEEQYDASKLDSAIETVKILIEAGADVNKRVS